MPVQSCECFALTSWFDNSDEISDEMGLTFAFSRSILFVNSRPTWKRAPLDQSPNQFKTHLKTVMKIFTMHIITIQQNTHNTLLMLFWRGIMSESEFGLTPLCTVFQCVSYKWEERPIWCRSQVFTHFGETHKPGNGADKPSKLGFRLTWRFRHVTMKRKLCCLKWLDQPEGWWNPQTPKGEGGAV